MKLGATFHKLITARLFLGLVLLSGLVAFDLFNYDSTRFALENMIGEVRFLTLTWAQIIAFASCAIDLAGVAKIFTPEQDMRKEDPFVWVLVGVWFIAAILNAFGTWWSMVVRMTANPSLGTFMFSREELISTVPAVLASFILLIRVGLIGSVAQAGDSWLWSGKPARHTVSRNAIHAPRTASSPVSGQMRAITPPRPQTAPVTPPAAGGLASLLGKNGNGKVPDFED
jgi:hypothetical protein